MMAEKEYNEILAEYDAIALPTTVVRAFEKEPEMGRVEALRREVSTIANTSIFNVTGHPAISVPCGAADGLPIGLMLVGNHLDETTLFTLAAAIENDRSAGY
jgi:amidase